MYHTSTTTSPPQPATGSSSASARTFVLDTQPPEVKLHTTPAASSPQAVALTAWDATDQSRVGFACRVNVSGGAAVQGDVYDDRGLQVRGLGSW